MSIFLLKFKSSIDSHQRNRSRIEKGFSMFLGSKRRKHHIKWLRDHSLLAVLVLRSFGPNVKVWEFNLRCDLLNILKQCDLIAYSYGVDVERHKHVTRHRVMVQYWSLIPLISHEHRPIKVRSPSSILGKVSKYHS